MPGARRLIFLAGGLVILIISFYGYFLNTGRPGLPPGRDPARIIRVENLDIKNPREIAFALAGKAPGESARIAWKAPEGRIEEAVVTLVPYYAPGTIPLVFLAVGLLSFILGAFVYFLGPGDTRSHIFYWLSLCFGAAVIINGELYSLQKSWLSIVPGVLYLACYALVFPLLLHFSLTFVRKKISWEKIPIYLSALVFVIPFEFLFLKSVLNRDLGPYRFYLSHFFLYRFYVILMISIAVALLIIGHRKSSSSAEKIRINWILYGLFLGVMPFLIFYQLPEILGFRPWLSEEISSLFFIFVPAALAIAILKYRLFDIHLIIKRSLAYSLLSLLIVSVYFLIVQVVGGLFSRFFTVGKNFLSIIGILAAAAAFQPLREKVQTLVDRTFYRTSFDYKNISLDFTRRAGEILEVRELAGLLHRTITDSLPVEKLGLALTRTGQAGQNTYLEEISLGEPLDKLMFELFGSLASRRLLAEPASVQLGEGLDFSQEKLLAGLGWALVMVFPLKSGDWSCLVALGPKKSGTRFNDQDLEFLTRLGEAFMASLEKIRLQGEVIYERATAEKLAELNRLKTEFISTVSHELRTPLSSLQVLAEVLHSGKVRDGRKKEEVLGLMEEECRRLSHLLHNILDFGRIELGTKTFVLRRTEVNPVLEEVFRLFAPRLEKEGFASRLELPREPVYIEADPDALKQALVNLIDNAIKYSTENREIELSLRADSSEVWIQVRDRGMGISTEDREKIFDSFYRGQKALSVNPQGVGLGLKIVKHIMEAHRGRIELESEPGAGSTFSLIFPRP